MNRADLPTPQGMSKVIRHMDTTEIVRISGEQLPRGVGSSSSGSSLPISGQLTPEVTFQGVNGKLNSGAPEFSTNAEPQATESLSGLATRQDRNTDSVGDSSTDGGDQCGRKQMELWFDFDAACNSPTPPSSDSPVAPPSAEAQALAKKTPGLRAGAAAALPHRGASPIFSKTGHLENTVTSSNIQMKEHDDFPSADSVSASEGFHAKCLVHKDSSQDIMHACSSDQHLATSPESNSGPVTLPTEAHSSGKRSGEPLPVGRPVKTRRTEHSAPQIVNSVASATPSGSTGFYDYDRRGEGSSMPRRKSKRKSPGVCNGMSIEDWKRSPEYQSRRHGCEVCGDRFTRTDNLQRHIANKHGVPEDWPCPNQGCNEHFARKDNGMQHLKLRHKNACSACNRQFPTAAKLVAHLKKTSACS